jgi:plasmid stabilization system protein ParE
MGRLERTTTAEDRIATLQRLVARLASPEVTLVEAAGVRAEIQRLLEGPGAGSSDELGLGRGAGASRVCCLRAAC